MVNPGSRVVPMRWTPVLGTGRAAGRARRRSSAGQGDQIWRQSALKPGQAPYALIILLSWRAAKWHSILSFLDSEGRRREIITSKIFIGSVRIVVVVVV